MKIKLPAWAVLTLITTVAAVLLGGVYELTADTIELRAREDARMARLVLAPGADGEREVSPAPEGLLSLYEMTADGRLVGYVGATVVTGFSGDVQVTVGVSPDGALTGVNVGGTSFSETPGLGAKAREPAFTDQFAGRRARLKLKRDVDAVTSATITSKAVVDGVNKAAAAIVVHAALESTGWLAE